MWVFIESAYKKLSEDDKAKIKAANLRFGDHMTFIGFDGNSETEHMSIARFLIDDMGRWQAFKGRELNSHFQVLDTYRRMYRIFEPMRKTLHGGAELTAAQLIKIMGDTQLHVDVTVEGDQE